MLRIMQERTRHETKPTSFGYFFMNFCTVPQPSIMIIYNSTWSVVILQIRIILSGDNLTLLSGDNLTQTIQKKAYFLFVINLITRSKKIYRIGRSLKICGTTVIPLCFRTLKIIISVKNRGVRKQRVPEKHVFVHLKKYSLSSYYMILQSQRQFCTQKTA